MTTKFNRAKSFAEATPEALAKVLEIASKRLVPSIQLRISQKLIEH